MSFPGIHCAGRCGSRSASTRSSGRKSHPDPGRGKGGECSIWQTDLKAGLRGRQPKILEGLESKAISDIKSFVGNRDLPVTLSFSGGKDSLACYGIAKKAKLKITLIFIDTGLEFPDTVDYVHNFVAKHNEHIIEASAGNAFWEQVDTFGPPAKDFRWCCKVCKLGPLTSAIEDNFPKGTITIEGNRGLESFSRSRMNFVESNPFVPNQTVLNPIRDWRAVDVSGDIFG